MARTPIQLTPPTFEPGFSARAFAAGGEAGAQAGRNVVSLVETASRERIAKLNATMRAQELSAQERMFLEEQKNDTNQFLQELELRREQQAQEIQNRVQLQNSEQAFREKMVGLTGEDAVGKLRKEQIDSIQYFSGLMDDGVSMNDPKAVAAANRVAVAHGQVNDVMERAQWNEAGGGDPSDYNWHRAQARGSESAANASWRDFNMTLASINSLEQRANAMRTVPGPDARKEHLAAMSGLAEALGIYNTFMDRAGKPRRQVDFNSLEHVDDIRTREEQIAAARPSNRMAQWGARMLAQDESEIESPSMRGAMGDPFAASAIPSRAVMRPASVMTNAVNQARSAPMVRAVTRTGATSPVQPQPAPAPAPAAPPTIDPSIPRRSASAQSISEAMDEIRRAGLRHAETDIRF